ncbi:uncharacterized protein PV07_12817 [Cladophialophora immunda]|uniref:Uncharacterized protein n=1 Tax=Cladophialophora immunda TaxID=569365 RepID=A0A0D2BRP9_9EURO|nr:uncharacterized protein PV07_12817 [Cladophialophora immunda]KIW21753.1 hypothetical protein PV07_12817 [Cladophialophora immunda]
MRSTVIGRAKITTYDDLAAARNKRGAVESGIAGRARKSAKRQKKGPSPPKTPKTSSDAPSNPKETDKEMSGTRGLESYCSVLQF